MKKTSASQATAFIGLVASLIGIFVFVTGKSNVQEVINYHEKNCPDEVTSVLNTHIYAFETLFLELKKPQEDSSKTIFGNKTLYQHSIYVLNKDIPLFDSLKIAYPECKIEANATVKKLSQFRATFQSELNKLLVNE